MGQFYICSYCWTAIAFHDDTTTADEHSSFFFYFIPGTERNRTELLGGVDRNKNEKLKNWNMLLGMGHPRHPPHLLATRHSMGYLHGYKQREKKTDEKTS